MRRLNIIWMFLGGLAAALALVLVREGRGPLPVGSSEAARDAEPAVHESPRADANERGAPASGRAETPRAAPSASPHAAAGADPDARAALASELLAMAEGYRNRVFLQAIRERGHFCDTVVDTQLGDEDVVVWRVGCGHGNAFLIGIDADGELAIEPLYYGDPSPAGTAPTLSPEPRQQNRVLPIEPE